MAVEPTTQSVVVLAPEQVPAARRLAAAHGAEVELLPSRGIEPVMTATLVLAGAVAAVAAVLHVLDQRKGGQVVDLRPGAPKALFRTPDVVFGTVIIVTADGRVAVEVREPEGMFGKVIAALPDLISGADGASEVAGAVSEVFGPEVRIEITERPDPEQR